MEGSKLVCKLINQVEDCCAIILSWILSFRTATDRALPLAGGCPIYIYSLTLWLQ